MSVLWYHAAYDEIWERTHPNTLIRGQQFLIKVPNSDIQVPDGLCLFSFTFDIKIWREHVRNGWLIRLGSI